MDQLKPCTNVTPFQSLSDRISAIIHSLFRFHEKCNPFELYNNKLTSQINFFITKREIGLHFTKTNAENMTLANNSRTRKVMHCKIASLAEEVNEKKKELEEAEKTDLFKEGEFNSLFKDIEKRYNSWYKALGRPPYYETFNYRSLFQLTGFNKISGEGEVSGGDGKVKSWIANKISKYLVSVLYLAYPAEVYFALPAFQFITPENKHAAIAGALILVVMLAVMGYFTGLILLRSRTNYISQGSSDSDITGPQSIKSNTSIYNTTLLCLIVLASLTVVMTGTALRTLVYDVERNMDEVKEINDKIDKLNDERNRYYIDGFNDAGDKLGVELRSLDDKRYRLIKDRESFRFKGIFPRTTDGYLALAIYLVLYLSPVLHVLISRDPYPEYHLLSIQMNNISEAKRLRELSKYAYVKLLKAEYDEMNKNLIELRKENDIHDIEKDEDSTEKVNNFVTGYICMLKNQYNAWRVQRLSTYYSIYMLLRGHGVNKSLGENAIGEMLK